MNDIELLGYAALHCRTELGQFHKEHVKRLFLLAGQAPPKGIDRADFWSLGPGDVDPLIQSARAVMKAYADGRKSALEEYDAIARRSADGVAAAATHNADVLRTENAFLHKRIHELEQQLDAMTHRTDR